MQSKHEIVSQGYFD